MGEDSASASFAGRHRSELGVLGGEPLRLAVEAVWQSAFGFTRNPISGVSERVIEASWGLGDAVVQGRVIPDLHRLAQDGALLQCEARAAGACLDAEQLAALHELALACDAVWDGHHDLEWAFDGDGTLHLLQRRPVTA